MNTDHYDASRPGARKTRFPRGNFALAARNVIFTPMWAFLGKTSNEAGMRRRENTNLAQPAHRLCHNHSAAAPNRLWALWFSC